MRIRMSAPIVLLSLPAIVLAGAAIGLARSPEVDPLRSAARAFLASLPPEQLDSAAMPFEDPNRHDWHYVPRDRRGLALKDMTPRARLAAHHLLQAALSSRGYLKATSIMQLDEVLRDMARSRGQQADHRDPTRYWFTIFGDPASADAPWGWRVEGHHLSLNFTSTTGGVSVTPAFLGANPAEVREGDFAGLRVLSQEEDLARELLASLDEDQKGRAVLAADAPADILLSPDTAATVLGELTGLAFTEMRPEQSALATRIIFEWAGNLEDALAAEQIARIDAAGLDRVRFLWIGSLLPGEPHYYRLHGPTFVIEYDCTQDGANHIHTVWRDLERDFGHDLLREHLGQAHSRD